MRPEQLNPNHLEAQSLKIAILRLLNAYQTPCEVHSDDWQYDESSLVLVLGRRTTSEARQALLDLLDFIVTDAIWDAIVTVVEEDLTNYLPLMKARIGQPLCAEAARLKPYVDTNTREGRDKQIKSWLAEYGRES